MKISATTAAAVALLLATFSFGAQAQAPLPGPVLQQVEVPVNRARVPGSGTGPVFVRYILIDPGNADPSRDGFMPLERIAVLVLYIGGDGTLNLGAGQVNTGSPNTVARNRYHFAAEGYVVAVVDAANDFNITPIGLRERRLGAAHLADLQAVMADLRGQVSRSCDLGRRPQPRHAVRGGDGSLGGAALGGARADVVTDRGPGEPDGGPEPGRP